MNKKFLNVRFSCEISHKKSFPFIFGISYFPFSNGNEKRETIVEKKNERKKHQQQEGASFPRTN